ncbi:ADP-ribosylation factor-related protein 1 isoform X4 [Pan paniscus]|nr:ADP-ribosylation factor-related protein 1 isoform X4 [Pan paniscus]
MSLSKITTTVGLNIGTVDVGKARLMFWDLGGQEELQSLWDKYYAECHGVIYVIDSTDEERLAESKQAFEGGDQRGAVRCPRLGAGQQAGCGDLLLPALEVLSPQGRRPEASSCHAGHLSPEGQPCLRSVWPSCGDTQVKLRAQRSDAGALVGVSSDPHLFLLPLEVASVPAPPPGQPLKTPLRCHCPWEHWPR